MHVAAILDAKGSDVVTLPQHCTLSEAARVLSEQKIGTVVITASDGQMLGILSERDIVRALAQRSASALDEPVSAYMTHAVKTTSRQELIRSIMERMTQGRFRHMPVIDDGRLIGIVSIGDVVKHRLAEIEAEASAMREYIASA